IFFVSYCFYFFFQAEDGIRDFHVTGVQTCALPIYLLSNLDLVTESFTLMAGMGKVPFFMRSYKRCTPVVVSSESPLTPGANSGRSEERRVGKECRYRWSGEYSREDIRCTWG